MTHYFLLNKHSVLTLSSFLLAVLQVMAQQQQLLHPCEIKKKTGYVLHMA
jgi:hypothetical protein